MSDKKANACRYLRLQVYPYLLGNPNLGDTHRISDHIGLTSNTYNGYSLIRLKKGL